VNVIIEYMDRGSLRDIMTKTRKKNYKFKESELALIAIQILNGLSYLHIVAK
jgi:serine/threonine protein kinase